MIDHVSIAVKDLILATKFYEAVLGAIGYKKIVDRQSMVGFGKKYPEFWLNSRPDMNGVASDTGVHICLRAKNAEAVTEFHRIALQNGGTDEGAPGPRQAAMTTYFGAFIKDKDGNKIEAVSFPSLN
ncbi:VOC family protein [Sneathiella limimaris]|uniref:VOC family protein n=1 Tax=Sneathiella limimaris TaxID=1964213 RepID=UPI00146D3A7E|nr:VOC family protein [Sneathiella limimaris]